MATLHEWAEAYRQQALRDLAAAKLVQGAEPSLLAMLLQMTFEKLGKAALLRSQMMTIEAAQRVSYRALRGNRG